MKNILFASSEVVPFIKTGGLADVVGSLPKCFDKSQYDIRVIMPKYECMAQKWKDMMKYVTHFYMGFNGEDRYVGVLETEYDGVHFYFIDNESYFSGPKPYTDWHWDIEKFMFFDRAVLSALPVIGFRPDLIHCHDWQTGLIPVYLNDSFQGGEFFRGIKTVMTIHNLKFQGVYNAKYMSRVSGLPMDLFTIDKLLTYDDGNMLKGGLVYADRITTVSETYAEEIKTPDYGEGLDGLFRARSHEFCGIVNGIDDQVFDPTSDRLIPHRYSLRTVLSGKIKNKLALQRQLGLEEDDSVMMFGIVSRLTEQKGMELIARVLPDLMASRAQLVVLGTGEYHYENVFRSAAQAYPGRLSANFTYSEELSHRIYAASDAFIMPSRFEPCGLSQLIALRYGSLPIVRETGGLKDTVVPYNRFTGEGTGFSFQFYDSNVFLSILRDSLKTFYEDRKAYAKLQRQAMEQDFSWEASAKKYEEMYQTL